MPTPVTFGAVAAVASIAVPFNALPSEVAALKVSSSILIMNNVSAEPRFALPDVVNLSPVLKPWSANVNYRLL